MKRFLFVLTACSIGIAQSAVAAPVTLDRPYQLVARACERIDVDCTGQTLARSPEEKFSNLPLETLRIVSIVNPSLAQRSLMSASDLAERLAVKTSGRDGRGSYQDQELVSEIARLEFMEISEVSLEMPLPAAAPLMLMGLGGLIAVRRRRSA